MCYTLQIVTRLWNTSKRYDLLDSVRLIPPPKRQLMPSHDIISASVSASTRRIRLLVTRIMHQLNRPAQGGKLKLLYYNSIYIVRMVFKTCWH
jgi:hypothetical protein